MVITSAVITGAASGLGRALAVELAGRGAQLVLADLNEVGLLDTARMIEAAGRQVVTITGDVRDPGLHRALLAAGVERFQGVDLWVNNAGVAVAGNVGDVPLEDWQWVIDINLMGVVNGCHVAAPYLRERKSGAILNVASAAGLMSTPGMAPYNAAKAAVVSLTEAMYSELREHGVGATVLCPTFFQTNLLDTARATDPGLNKVAAKLMSRSNYTAADVARAAIQDVLARRLHSVPMADGRWLWRARRLLPQTWQDRAADVSRRLAGKRKG